MPKLSNISQRNVDSLLNAAGEFSIAEINALKALVSEFSGGDSQSSYGSGTAYTLTTTASVPTQSSGSPSITFAREGTYELHGSITLLANAVTSTTQSVVTKIRRTNNTAQDVPNSSVSLRLPALTTATQTVAVVRLPPVIVYANAGDIYQIHTNIDAALGAGTITATQSGLVAVRLY